MADAIIGSAVLNATVTLSNGVVMPRVGYGCAGRLGRRTLGEALAAGYRGFDTSQAKEWYLEEELGAAVAAALASGNDNGAVAAAPEGGGSPPAVGPLPASRAELFLETKLHPRDHGEKAALRAFPTSLRQLQTTYVDAFLLHYPSCFGDLCGPTPPEGTWRDSWRALETLYDAGQTRAIGVSNFSPEDLRQLLAHARIRPHLVQSWMDPLQQARPLRALCAQHGILFQAYSTLGTQWLSRTRINPVLRHPTLAAVGREVGRSAAQVALRWALQHGVAVIPRSSKPRNMAANLRLFDFALSDEHMAAIDALDGTDATSVRAPPPPPRSCEDTSAACGEWAEAGECDANPAFMHTSCAASCDTCPQKVEL